MAILHPEQIRDLLLPGLRGIVGRYRAWPQMQWEELFAKEAAKAAAAPSMPMPAIIGVKSALVIGAAATIIKNPIITRRWWQGWSL